MLPRKILLNPGPCTTSERVKQALVMPDLCPREAEFGEMVAAVRTKLLKIASAPTDMAAVLIGGSGTSAVEAALSSLIGPNDRLLVINNGAYGLRGEQIAAAHQLEHRAARWNWGDVPRLAQVEAALDESPRPTHCFFVHHETTTGMLNPLDDLVAACRRRGVVTLVDAISSFGGVPLDLGTTPVDCVLGSANKCLQGLPGIAFALVRRDLIRRVEMFPRRTLSLHLPDLLEAQDKASQFLYTPPVQVLNAFHVALDEFLAEGAAARHARYAACHARLLAGMKRLGFACFVPERWQSGILTAFHEPAHPAWSFQAMHDWLYARGITVYPGKIAGLRTFRIANLGDLTPVDLDLFITHLESFLVERGIAIP